MYRRTWTKTPKQLYLSLVLTLIQNTSWNSNSDFFVQINHVTNPRKTKWYKISILQRYFYLILQSHPPLPRSEIWKKDPVRACWRHSIASSGGLVGPNCCGEEKKGWSEGGVFRVWTMALHWHLNLFLVVKYLNLNFNFITASPFFLR